VDQICLIPPAPEGEESHQNIFPVSPTKFKYYGINSMKSWDTVELGTPSSIF